MYLFWLVNFPIASGSQGKSGQGTKLITWSKWHWNWNLRYGRYSWGWHENPWTTEIGQMWGWYLSPLYFVLIMVILQTDSQWSLLLFWIALSRSDNEDSQGPSGMASRPPVMPTSVAGAIPPMPPMPPVPPGMMPMGPMGMPPGPMREYSSTLSLGWA